jgi:hypothetical protein
MLISFEKPDKEVHCFFFGSNKFGRTNNLPEKAMNFFKKYSFCSIVEFVSIFATKDCG